MYITIAIITIDMNMKGQQSTELHEIKQDHYYNNNGSNHSNTRSVKDLSKNLDVEKQGRVAGFS